MFEVVDHIFYGYPVFADKVAPNFWQTGVDAPQIFPAEDFIDGKRCVRRFEMRILYVSAIILGLYLMCSQ